MGGLWGDGVTGTQEQMTQFYTLVSCDPLRGRVSSSVALWVSHLTWGLLMSGGGNSCISPSEPPPSTCLPRFDIVSVRQHTGPVPCLAHSENTELQFRI